MRIPKLINVEREDKEKHQFKWLRVLDYYERNWV